jgi:hypothetical protein
MSEKTMLTELTPEMEVIANETKQYWLDKFFSCKNRTNKEQAIIGINWLYSLAGRPAPEIVFVDSPYACQIVARERTNTDAFFEFPVYGNVWDYAWVAFYDFFHKIGIVENEDFVKYRELMESNICDMIQLDSLCIVSDMPTKISRDAQNRLHCDDGKAIEWADGYGQYYWRGISVPEKWILDPGSISNDDIKHEGNLELKRCLMEIVGPERYYEILGGVVVIDEDNDQYGKPMKLLRSKDIDTAIDDYVYFLLVTDTSTDRVYSIYPNIKEFPEAKKNVFSAKASTFRKTKEQFDVLDES